MPHRLSRLILLTLVVGGCSTEESSEPAHAITALVDGREYASYEATDGARAGVDTAKGLFTFTSSSDSAYGPNSEQISLTIWSFHGAGHYTLDGNQTSGSTGIYTVRDSAHLNNPTDFATLGLVPRGEIVIKHFDARKEWIDGTFGFTGIDFGGNGDSVKVTRGKFQGRIYVVPPPATRGSP